MGASVDGFIGGVNQVTQRLTRGVSSAQHSSRGRWFKGAEDTREEAQERYSKEVTCLALSTLSAFDLSHDSLDLGKAYTREYKTEEH
jgi:hypothetical protein